jgi:hypothetical protein
MCESLSKNLESGLFKKWEPFLTEVVCDITNGNDTFERLLREKGVFNYMQR